MRNRDKVRVTVTVRVRIRVKVMFMVIASVRDRVRWPLESHTTEGIHGG